jgi:hypothetical protein
MESQFPQRESFPSVLWRRGPLDFSCVPFCESLSPLETAATWLGIGDEIRLVLPGAGVGGDRKPFALSLIIMISVEGEDFMLVDWNTFAKKDLNEPSSAISMY